jgi:hypothetical protein
MATEAPNAATICICYPSSVEPYELLVKDIIDVLSQYGHHAWALNISQAETDQVLESLQTSDWLLTFLTPEQRKRIVDNSAIDHAVRQKIINNAVLTIRLTSPDHASAPIALAHIQWADLSEFSEYYPDDRTDEKQVREWQQWLAEKCHGLHKRIAAGNNLEAHMARLAEQLKPSAYDATVVRTAEGFVGREWLIKEIEQWLEQSNERICLLEAPPGVGKTALSAYLAEAHPNIIGVHFCTAEPSPEQTLNAFVRTFALQLAARSANYRRWLLAQLQEQGKFSAENFQTMTPVTLANELIFNAPEIDAKGLETSVIIIDGIDRAVLGDNSQRDNYQPDLVDLLVKEFAAKLPQNIRLLVTSRKERGISELFSAKKITVSVNDARHLTDVETFLRQSLDSQSRGTEPADSDVDNLAKAVGSSMLYANSLITALKHGKVSLPVDTPPDLNEVAEYYRMTMHEIFGDDKWRAPKNALAPADLARALVAHDGPVSKQQLMAKLSLKPRALGQALAPLYPLLAHEQDEKGNDTIALFHPSFARWLTAPRQPHAYQL